jgi:hypothetical protein
MRWAGHVAHMGEINVFKGKPDGKRALGRPKRRWEDKTTLNFREICWGV